MGFAQITPSSFNNVRLNDHITNYPDCIHLSQYEYSILFHASENDDFYFIPNTNVQSSDINVKYAFAFVNGNGFIKGLTLFIDDQDRTSLPKLEAIFGIIYSIGLSGLQGMAHYFWCTSDNTQIGFANVDIDWSVAGFMVSMLNIIPMPVSLDEQQQPAIFFRSRK